MWNDDPAIHAPLTKSVSVANTACSFVVDLGSSRVAASSSSTSTIGRQRSFDHIAAGKSPPRRLSKRPASKSLKTNIDGDRNTGKLQVSVPVSRICDIFDICYICDICDV